LLRDNVRGLNTNMISKINFVKGLTFNSLSRELKTKIIKVKLDREINLSKINENPNNLQKSTPVKS